MGLKGSIYMALYTFILQSYLSSFITKHRCTHVASFILPGNLPGPWLPPPWPGLLLLTKNISSSFSQKSPER